MSLAAPQTQSVLNDGKPPVHLRVDNLRVRYKVAGGYLTAVDGVTLEVMPGHTIGLVGESGCGKSTVAKAILRLLPEDAQVDGEVLLDGRDVLHMTPRELRGVRWTKLALITQSAMNSLDPVYRIGDQIVESIQTHEKTGAKQAWARAEELFTLVGIAPERLRDYPHQFSGGMRQRAVIAMALSLNAGLLLADEPTTALDSIMQDQVLARIRRLQEELSRSMILITHDVAVVAETCETLAVMYAGKIVETGPTAQVLTETFHPYTIGLRNAFPTISGEERELISIPGNLPSLIDPPEGCRFASRCPFSTEQCKQIEPPLVEVGERHLLACHYPERAGEFRSRGEKRHTWDLLEARAEPPAAAPSEAAQDLGFAPISASTKEARPVITVSGLRKHFVLGGGIISSVFGMPGRLVKAVDGVDLTIREGEVFGLVGESGSGKSTLGMTLVRLHHATSGRIDFKQRDVTAASGPELKAYRRDAQIIFQDPYGSLNPRLTVAQVVEEPLRIHGLRDKTERATKVAEALERVRMPSAEYLNRYPHELSGGQRQRIAIARAIVLEPKFIVADEPVSMLDVSIQAGILELLERLAREFGLAVLYVSHDIATVRYICDRVAVMYRGRFVEHGNAHEVTARSQHPYTKRLMAAVPSADPTVTRKRVELLEEEILLPEAPGYDGPRWSEIGPDHFVADYS